jgi:16S rRNA (guanine966-N2)-methyltransferase
VVFLDPPYKSQLEKPVFEYLKTSSLLAENALIIVETARDTDFSYLGEAGFAVVREKNYKTNAHIFIQREGKDETSNLSGEL